MGDVRSRLLNCFATVFPVLSEEEITAASIDTVGSWDSLTSAVLISTVEEEFGIQVALDDLMRFVSFELIFSYLQNTERLHDA
jgi:acyl carrier protein